MTRCHARSFRVRCSLMPCLLLLTAHCLLLTAFGQSATATLSGTVEDQNGAVVPNASVSVADPAKGIKRQAATNDQGYFIVPLLPPSIYTVTVENRGFAPVQIQNVVLNVGDQKALQIQLKAGDVNATVQVNTEAPLINESPAVGTVVDRQFVENLPLNGRSFHALLELTPGTVLTKTSYNEKGQFSVNGQRANANYFTIDGVSANIGVSQAGSPGQSEAGSLPGLSAFGSSSNLVSVDALQEFKVQTSSFAPEFGRTTGAQVQIVTRSGTNEFRGTLFEYFRNDTLDANDWFANSRGLPKAALRQNDFGVVLGGPIVKDRTFFFFSYEGLRLRQPQSAIRSVPSLTARQSAAAELKQLLNVFPIPNGPDLGNGHAEFSATYSDPSSLDGTSIRIDHAVGDKLQLFGRYNYAPSETRARGGLYSLSNVIAARLNTQTLTGGATWAMTSTLSNDFRLNWSRNSGPTPFLGDDFGGAIPLPDAILAPTPAVPAEDTQFILIIGDLTYVAGKATENVQRQVNLVDTVSDVHGSHDMKFGIDYRRLSPLLRGANYTQLLFFSDVPNVLEGAIPFYQVGSNSGDVEPVYTNLSIFAQDTWRATPRFTLTYGLRWEFNPPPKAKNGRDPAVVEGLDNPATMTLAPFGTPLWKTAYKNFAPRIGVAYQLSQRPAWETVLRGGWGIFYDLGNAQAGFSFAPGTFPYSASKNYFGVLFPVTPDQAAPPRLTLDPPYGFLRVYDPELKLPYSMQWNVAVEQSLRADQTVSATYVGALGRRLLRGELILNPNPDFFQFFIQRNGATSDYHALQFQFQRRLSRGLQALVSYTWAHSIDTVSDEATQTAPTTRFDPQQDRGPSDFDVRHTLSAALTYSIPAPAFGAVGDAVLGNWSLDTIVRARSATPVNVVTGTDLLGLGFYGTLVSRPDLVPGEPLYVDDPAVGGGRRINREAFSIPPAGRQGNLGRNSLRGFPAWQIDLALSRQFNLTERVNLQFRAELFNVLNHPNFGDPINSLGNPFFGQSTTMLGRSLGAGGFIGGFNPLYQIGGSRSTQFGLKVQF